jgi:two-component system, OmpR family, response regulator MprA
MRQSVIRTHDLEIDTASGTARRGGRVVALTKNEYALLRLLAEKCGSMVARTIIQERLYGGLNDGDTNAISQCIHGLRTKIDHGCEPALILTRPKQGYLLRADVK